MAVVMGLWESVRAYCLEADVSEVSTLMCSVTIGRADRTPVKRVSEVRSASSSAGEDGCAAMNGEAGVSAVSGVRSGVSWVLSASVRVGWTDLSGCALIAASYLMSSVLSCEMIAVGLLL